MSGSASTAAVDSNGPAPGGILEQMIDVGQISFTRVLPLGGLTNLLTINFTNAFLWGPNGASGVNYIDSTATGSVVFTSDFMDFTGYNIRDFSFGLSGLAPPLQIGNNGLLRSFTADTAGTFSVGIPEPATWAMMIMGFVGVGSALRSRRKAYA